MSFPSKQVQDKLRRSSGYFFRPPLLVFTPTTIFINCRYEKDRLFIFFHTDNFRMEKLLQPDKYKDIIIGSLKYLASHNKISVYAFVIMPNHIHIIWKILDQNYANVQRDFLKFTAQMIKSDLQQNHPEVLKLFYVNAKDRAYQIWERNPLSVEIINKSVSEQKVNYIHNNPLAEKWKLANEPQNYKYSSAKFYFEGFDEFEILTNYMDG